MISLLRAQCRYLSKACEKLKVMSRHFLLAQAGACELGLIYASCLPYRNHLQLHYISKSKIILLPFPIASRTSYQLHCDLIPLSSKERNSASRPQTDTEARSYHVWQVSRDSHHRGTTANMYLIQAVRASTATSPSSRTRVVYTKLVRSWRAQTDETGERRMLISGQNMHSRPSQQRISHPSAYGARIARL